MKIDDVQDPNANYRALDDKTYSIDHIEKKLMRLPNLMHTKTGKAFANQRAEFIQFYRSMLLSEIENQQS